MKGKKKPASGKKQVYKAPRVVVHGNVRELTQAKAGNKGDGTGKPATRTNGGMG